MATNSGPIASPQNVMTLVQKLGEADPDFRFMSLNDLLQLLANAKSDFLQHDYNVAARAVDGIIKTIDDNNGEVQNLAIKCLGPLVGKVPTPVLAPMIEKLSNLQLKNSVDTAVPSLALRAVLIALPRPVHGLPTGPGVQEAYDAVSRVLIPRLVGPGFITRAPITNISLPPLPQGMLHSENDLNAESVDVMIEVVRCFGPMLSQMEIEAMQKITIQLLENQQGTSVVKKRAVVAISMLAVYLSDDHLRGIVKHIIDGLSQSDCNQITRRLYISIIGSMTRSIPSRFGPYIASTAPFILKALDDKELDNHLERLSDGDDLGQEFNEVREAALVALEAFLASCPHETKPFTDPMIASCLRYLKYDPNYVMDDDDDMEVDGEEEDDDDDDEFNADDGFEDDDDDASWKVRRCAARTLYTLISTRGRGDLLDNGVLYGQAAPHLIKRIDEREESVRLEVISALSLLIRKTGEGLYSSESLDDYEPEPIAQLPSRKRRRQSSAAASTRFLLPTGDVSPARYQIPQTGPQADLACLVPTIVKAATKQLKGKTISTKQSILKLLDDLVSIQRGGLGDYFDTIINPLTEAIKTSVGGIANTVGVAGGSASATPSTLRITALKLVSDIFKTHSSSLLQPYLSNIVAAVTNAASSRYYKISSEAIQTAEELVKAITPPRLKNTTMQHKGELEQMYKVMVERCSASDADAEVRQRAIHALGVMVSRTLCPDGISLMSADQRKEVLVVLQERLKNETTRLAAVRAVHEVAAAIRSPDQLDEAWVKGVSLELSGQLRKSNRALRGSSILAMKYLVLSGALNNKFDNDTIEIIVSSLLPAIRDNDAHLLCPAFVILAQFVEKNVELVMTEEMVSALCVLLKAHIATIVLDPLLVLISNVGKCGAGGSLMNSLLRDVSVSGEPAVVGKVIGTLLVAGGSSSGVSVDSFTSELQVSSQTGDAARVSLALAVLGEVGKGLGTQSPLKPELFLQQFGKEPDKVSLSAAVALGRAGSSNANEFLPVILSKMKEGGNTQYLLIQSVKEILQSVPSLSSGVQSHAAGIWETLLLASENADNRVICAECAGRLVVLSPAEFLPKLQTLLSATSSAVRGMAVQAIRYTLPESDEALDEMLRHVLVEMLLTLLQDSDLEIRHLTMTTLNSATHNKPELVLPRLGELMPFVLQESVIKKELIKEVMMGPFRHLVDDGLEVRKGAYETLYALMETAFSRINNVEFYDRVVVGLSDDNDIRQLCNLMITKLMVIDADETARRLDSIAEAYRTILSTKLKDNAVKQDIEKQEETNKSILRVTLLLGGKMRSIMGGTGATGAQGGSVPASGWVTYWEWVNKDFAKELKSLKEENMELQTRVA